MIVSDSTALILLARIGRLELLREVVGEVWIPEAVAAEVRKPGKPGAEALEVALDDWIHVARVRDRERVEGLPRRLGLGEREAIVLAVEREATLLSDDKAARREAQAQGVDVTGLLAVLLEAKARGLIPEVKGVLDELVGEGFRLAPDLYEAVLREAGELPEPEGEEGTETEAEEGRRERGGWQEGEGETEGDESGT